MSGLLWKLKRLRLMSATEILFRLSRAVGLRFEQLRIARGWQPRPVGDVTARTCLFDTSHPILDEWTRHFDLDRSGLESYLAGSVGFFGHEPLSIGMPVEWHRDPVTWTVAPEVFGKSLNYRDDAIVGNVKFLWELGRHQHLVPLAVAYAITGEHRYRDNVVGQIEGWLDDSPYGIGIHWCSALEAALRMISWSLVHSLLALRDGEQGLFLAVKDSERFGLSIFQHCYFIRHFLSRYSSANNHLIGELTGLWVATQVFDVGPTGHDWADFAKAELEKEAIAQVYADGVDKEQAFYYHMWVLEYLLFARLVASRTGAIFSEHYDRTLHAMLRFLKDVSPDGGEPPQVGDADDGFVARFDPEWPVSAYTETMAAVETVFNKHHPIASQKGFWYRSIAGDLPSTADFSWVRNYPVGYQAGGYAVLGNNACHIVMDSGDLGYLAIAAHGHADALSVCLAIDGYWWLVDPGTYAYHSDARWRNYFRGSSGHNTIIINNQDQSTIAGPFMWTHKANGRMIHVGEKDGIQEAVGEHDGYQRLGVSHQRAVRFDPGKNEVQIIDNLTSKGENLSEIYFHFAPDIDLVQDEDAGHWIATRPNSSRRLVLKPDNQWTMDVQEGRENPVLGWYSPSLEQKVPTCTLHGAAKLSGELRSIISINVE